jgi:hypothetical protein
MQAGQLIEKSKSPEAWRKHARALRRAADAIWQKFEESIVEWTRSSHERGIKSDFELPREYLETSKLLYGLALETALKARIIENTPEAIEIKVTINGTGEAVQAELKNIGVPASQGHNLLALAEAAGLFGPDFSSVLSTELARDGMRNICRDLGEVVVWRGRYPVPLSSFEPIKLNPNVPMLALAHHIRDWLDPMFDALLRELTP